MRGNQEIGIVNHRATEGTRGVYRDRWQIEMILNRGYAVVTAYCGDLDPDNYQHDFSDGIQSRELAYNAFLENGCPPMLRTDRLTPIDTLTLLANLHYFS